VARTGSPPVDVDIPPSGSPIHVRIEYAGRIFFFGAIWRAFSTRRWLTIVPDLTPESAIPEGVTGQALPNPWQ